MENIDQGEHIQARRDAGLSYADIGAELGITKDAARGLHTRWAKRRMADAPLTTTEPITAARRSRAGRGVRRAADMYAYVNFSIGFFDLEASGLVGTYSRLHLGACAHADGSIWSVRIDEPKYRDKNRPSNDGPMCVAIRDHLETHDIIVSWNGKRGYSSQGRSGFDIPMLNARLLNIGERVVDRWIEHIDLLKESRRYLQLHSYRLAAVQEFLELQEEKNAILPSMWHRAMDYDKKALDYVEDHCRRDVLVLREVFEAFRRARILRRATR